MSRLSEASREPLTFLRLPEVMRRTAKCRSDIYRDIAKGIFPAPVKLGELSRSSAWSSQEVDAWIAERLASRPRA